MRRASDANRRQWHHRRRDAEPIVIRRAHPRLDASRNERHRRPGHARARANRIPVLLLTPRDHIDDKVMGLDQGRTTTSQSPLPWQSCQHAFGRSCVELKLRSLSTGRWRLHGSMPPVLLRRVVTVLDLRLPRVSSKSTAARLPLSGATILEPPFTSRYRCRKLNESRCAHHRSSHDAHADRDPRAAAVKGWYLGEVRDEIDRRAH